VLVNIIKVSNNKDTHFLKHLLLDLSIFSPSNMHYKQTVPEDKKADDVYFRSTFMLRDL